MVIYKTTNLVNGKQYIGRDKHNNPNYLGSGPLLKKAIKKYGKENFKKEIIEECSSFEQMVEREEYWLNYYDVGNNPSFYNRHNFSCGGATYGMTGKKHSEGHKKRISESLMGRKLSDETKKKMGLSKRGRIVSDETKKKMSQSKIGKQRHPRSEEHRKKLSEANIGKTLSDETKMKISIANRGRVRSDSVRKRISESLKYLYNKRKESL
jgi:group I intron endonuclease